MGGHALAAWTALDNDLIRSPALTVYEKAVYNVIKSHLNGVGVAWPSMTTIAAEANCSRMQVARALKSLVAGGYVSSVSRGKGRVNTYTTSTPQLQVVEQPVPASYTTSTPQLQGSNSQVLQPVPDSYTKKTNRRRTKKKNQEEVRVLTISDSFVQSMIALHGEIWGEQGVKDHIEEAVNYYLPEMRKGKYQNLEACVKGSLRRTVEREDRNGQNRNGQYPTVNSRSNAQSERREAENVILRKRGFIA